MRLAFILLSSIISACPLMAGLIGTEITGSYASRSNPDVNLFDPAQGNVPNGYLNGAGTTVMIGEPAIEFGEQTDISLITANFTDTQLILTNTPIRSGSNLIGASRFTFIGTGQLTSIELFSSDFSGAALSASLSGQSVTIDWGEFLTSSSPQTAVFNVGSVDTPGNVPEPGTLALLAATACLGFLRFFRRQIALLTVLGIIAIAGPQVAAASGPVSDEFNAPILNTALWTVVNPVGDGATTMSGTEARLTLPAGVPHDLWTGGNASLRLLQPAVDSDFYVEAKFNSDVASDVQDQGLVIAADASNYLRFDVYSDGVSVRYFIASFENDQPTIWATEEIASGHAPYFLRVRRTGSTWTGYWSEDGVNFAVAAQFALNLAVTQMGPFAANNNLSGGPSPAFTASIDYFHVLDSNGIPIAAPPPVPAADLTVALTHAGTLQQGANANYTATVTNLGTLGTIGPITLTDTLPPGFNYTSASGTGWVCGAAGQAVNCTFTDSIPPGASAAPVVISAAIAATPGQVINTVAVAGGGETNTANNTASDTGTVVPSPITPGAGPVSDDFHTGVLNPALWQFVNPAGDGSVSFDGSHALLHVPSSSSHDVWTNGNPAPRLMQTVPNGDFDVIAKFDSAIDLPCQTQGLIVQQDAANFLRFDVYSYGTAAYVFAAALSPGDNQPPIYVNQWIGDGIGVPFYIRVRRIGDQFTYLISTDSTTYTQVTQFSRQMTVSQIGPYAGNNACGYTAPAFTSAVDYFFNAASPIEPEDGIPNSNPVITFWYGNNQTFGQNGIPQKWVNIVGNVLSPIGSLKSLTYTLNGGAPRTLWMGPNATRLNQPGDFNVEIAYSDLRPGANTVIVVATDQLGRQTSGTVNVNYVAGRQWPLPYTIDWSKVTNIQDVVQVVDGKWALQPDGTVRTEEIGYDRLLNLGDMSSWRNYVVTAEMTIHYINDSSIPAPPSHIENVFGVGILVGWTGHTHDVFGNASPEQPGYGHPFPGIGWWSDSGGIGPWLSLYQNTASHPESVMAYQWSDGFPLQFETKYIFKMQVRQNGSGNSSHYSFKAWPAGTAEPPAWNVEGDGDLANGSVILGAHRTDVSIGKVTVNAIP
jgi:uncharacterized repeat protein (TIGR01451 family)